jgi:hypothetical protein
VKWHCFERFRTTNISCLCLSSFFFMKIPHRFCYGIVLTRRDIDSTSLMAIDVSSNWRLSNVSLIEMWRS